MQFVFSFLVTFLATIIATPLSLIGIKKAGLIDDPKTHKHPALQHKKPIPRGGGIPLFIGLWIGAFLFVPVSKITIGLFIASLLAVIVGTIDDKYDISRYFRLVMNFVCAAIVVGSGVGFAYITNPFGGVIHLDTIRWTFTFFGTHSIVVLSDLFALIWISWVMNMLNWSKGVDGQMPGVVAISAIVIGLLGLRFSLADPLINIGAHMSFALAGAMVGFLIFNFYPAKIFPGYGATGMYLILASLSILSTSKLATAILVMGVPMIDAIFTVIRRVVNGRSPFWMDNKHLHHLLLRLGYGHRAIALFYWIISAILGTVALTLSSTQKVFALIMVFVLVGGGILFLQITLHDEKSHN